MIGVGIALYPSKAMRALPAHVLLERHRLRVTIEDPLVLLDPDGQQSTEDIESFDTQITVFAVDMSLRSATALIGAV